MYFIFPDSYRDFYTNAGSDGSSEKPENNKWTISCDDYTKTILALIF